MEMGGWLIDYMDEVESSDFLWPSQILPCETASSCDTGLDVLGKEERCQKNSCSKKRTRAEPCTRQATKACREKIRRDKLNDRFLELCSILDPGRAPKTDKGIILGDAIRALKQLRLEAQKLRTTNEELQDTIKNLKIEKTELRQAKGKLMVEKERMEQVVNGMSIPSPFVPHPAFFMYAVPFAPNSKNIQYNGIYPPKMAMWQWMAPAFVDTSQDHVLRPPVA